MHLGDGKFQMPSRLAHRYPHIFMYPAISTSSPSNRLAHRAGYVRLAMGVVQSGYGVISLATTCEVGKGGLVGRASLRG